VTIQAQILTLIKRLRDEYGTAVVLITHDMGVVADIADQVAVMYAGRIVEQGNLRSLFYDAQHPYTWGLLGSIARLDRPRPRRLTAIRGLPPSLIGLPAGCAFGPRCTYKFDRCAEVPPLSDKVGDGHLDACFLDLAAKKRLRVTAIRPDLAGQQDLAARGEAP
jgi:oligopeptide/dipeptide ABC transporter ATP-binding protein